LEKIGTPESIQAIHAWRTSDVGKTYIERQAEEKLRAYLSFRPYSGWVESVFNNHDDNPAREQIALFRDSAILAIRKALRHPKISTWVAHDLERSGIPEALQLLKEWQDEGTEENKQD
jgi:hypothetical protein